MLALSRRNLERRFKKATSNTVVEYIQRVRVEAAKQNLESSRDNVNEVMYKVGYTDLKAFRSTFKRITGLSPGNTGRSTTGLRFQRIKIADIKRSGIITIDDPGSFSLVQLLLIILTF